MKANDSTNENLKNTKKIEDLQNKVNLLQEKCNNQFEKDIMKAVFIGAIPMAVMIFVAIKYAPMMATRWEMIIFQFGTLIAGSSLSFTIIKKSLSKSSKLQDELKTAKKEVEDEIERQKKDKELELSKNIKNTNISKSHDRQTDKEYVHGLKKYVDDVIELSKTNPALARESAIEALINTGVLDEHGNAKEIVTESYSDSEKQPKQLVKKPKKDNRSQQ